MIISSDDWKLLTHRQINKNTRLINFKRVRTHILLSDHQSIIEISAKRLFRRIRWISGMTSLFGDIVDKEVTSLTRSLNVSEHKRRSVGFQVWWRFSKLVSGWKYRKKLNVQWRSHLKIYSNRIFRYVGEIQWVWRSNRRWDFGLW